MSLIYLTLIAGMAAVMSCSPLSPLPLKPELNTAQGHAHYVGASVCSSCHELETSHWNHTIHARIPHLAAPDNPKVEGCETCHGPGSEHLSDPADKSKIMVFTYQSGSTINQQNSMCLQCHRGKERIAWPGSAHQMNDLGCSDCHNPMARFSERGLLRKDGINQTCYSCHQEKRGPFIWEHASVRENCLNCHQPHGSNHESLLVSTRPFLCQSCHANRGHPNDLLTTANLAAASSPDARLINRSCQNCHAQIHGSNHSAGMLFHR